MSVARAQGARAWELRTSNTLAHLWEGQGNRAKARELLTPVYERFTEGLSTADLREARALVESVE